MPDIGKRLAKALPTLGKRGQVWPGLGRFPRRILPTLGKFPLTLPNIGKGPSGALPGLGNGAVFPPSLGKREKSNGKIDFPRFVSRQKAALRPMLVRVKRDFLIFFDFPALLVFRAHRAQRAQN
ncbi:MAG: hypothetical protein IJS32_07455 [Kiritimatiellae bacterium]|nr:hypothetical protein [Kiritimatiellia bacterium]